MSQNGDKAGKEENMTVTIEPMKKGRPTKKPDVNTLNNMCKMHTVREIAIFYDVAPSTVRSWISRYRKQAEQEQNDSRTN